MMILNRISSPDCQGGRSSTPKDKMKNVLHRCVDVGLFDVRL